MQSHLIRLKKRNGKQSKCAVYSLALTSFGLRLALRVHLNWRSEIRIQKMRRECEMKPYGWADAVADQTHEKGHSNQWKCIPWSMNRWAKWANIIFPFSMEPNYIFSLNSPNNSQCTWQRQRLHVCLETFIVCFSIWMEIFYWWN